MGIIISHNQIDFDGFAASIAAQKLFPGSIIVLIGKASRNVQEFLSLHKDTFTYKYAHQINTNDIKDAIIVDTAKSIRLGPLKDFFAKNMQKVKAVYDHHPTQVGDFQPGIGKIDKTGAVTTILVEEIKKQKIALTPLEATVLALGIYEDTGNLTFTNTTARDVYAAAFLLENGANLAIIANFIEHPLTEEQRTILNNLLANHEVINVHGYKILIARASVEGYVGGLDIVTHKLAELSNADVIFTIVVMGEKTYLVARSRTDAADVGRIAKEFGGGGHNKAASAVIRSKMLDDIIENLKDLLAQTITPALTAEKLMSSPVKTLSPNVSIREAVKIMLRYGHSGLPVVKNNCLVGIISRRDIEKARHHGLGHAPVKAFMSTKVITIQPETSLADIQRIMMEKDIGRLPVVKDGNLVGIVSRTDVLKNMHGEILPNSFQVNFLQACSLKKPLNLAELMADRLPEDIFQMVVGIGKLADKFKFRVYLVGGFVRDLILERPNYDLDLVVEGDGLTFARLLAEKLGAKVRAHEKFGTAVIALANGEKIDVATARTEFYEYPAALPTVETSTLKQDLYRRDFTINAMALCVNLSSFAEFIDFFNGRDDLDNKLIRVLHNLSFIEDPTRIIRAVRFEQRYGFKIEEQTLAFARHAIENNLIEELSYNRIRAEFELILQEKNPLPALQRLKEIGLWQHIFPELELAGKLWERLTLAFEYAHTETGRNICDIALVYLCVLFSTVSKEKADVILERFQWPKKERETVQEFLLLIQKESDIFSEGNITLYQLHLRLMDKTIEALLAFSMTLTADKRILLQKYCERKFSTKLCVTGNDLKQFGINPGPYYKILLTETLAAKIDGQLKNKQEEIDFIKKLLKTENSNVQ